MIIRGIDYLTPEELQAELARGGRFVFYEYCISLLFLTLRRPSAIIFLRANEHGIVRGLPYTFLSLVLGWWGFPWGLIYTPLVVVSNLAGGRDVTAQVRPVVLPELL